MLYSEFAKSFNNKAIMYIHNGGFHADDVLAVALVKALQPSVCWKRTRHVPDGDFAVDVGGGPYDHHSVPRPKWEEYDAPHCGASRLWVDPFFQEVFTRRFGVGPAGRRWMEETLFLPICREDNGLPSQGTNLLGVVRHMNPGWDAVPDQDFEDTCFAEAVALAEKVLEACINQARCVDRAQYVLEDIPDEEIVRIPAGLSGWKDHLSGKITKFVIYPALSGGWSVQSVPPAPDRVTEQKIPHPVSWRGLRNEALSEASGLPGGIFCHASGFLSIWLTEADAWRAARWMVQNSGSIYEPELFTEDALADLRDDDVQKIPPGLKGWEPVLANFAKAKFVIDWYLGAWRIRGVPSSPEPGAPVKVPFPKEWHNKIEGELVRETGLPAAIECQEDYALWGTILDALDAARLAIKLFEGDSKE